jgi:hypothetical protein
VQGSGASTHLALEARVAAVPGAPLGGAAGAAGQGLAAAGGELCGEATGQHSFSFRRPVALLEVQVPPPAAGGPSGAQGLRLQVLLRAQPLPGGEAAGGSEAAAAARAALESGAEGGAGAEAEGIYGFRGAGHSAGPYAARDVPAAPSAAAVAGRTSARQQGRGGGEGALGAGSFSAISRLVHGPGAEPEQREQAPSSATKPPRPLPQLPQLLQPSDSDEEGEGGGSGMPPLTPDKQPGLLPASAKEPAGAVAAEAPAAAPFNVQLVSQSPRVAMVDGFLPPQLCQQLMELARPRLIRSRVASGARQAARLSDQACQLQLRAQHAECCRAA